MSFSIRPVQSFATTIHASAETAYGLLAGLAGEGVNLLAFTAIPVGLGATQLVLTPEDGALLSAVAPRLGLILSGPSDALLIQGDDELGALARVHEQLATAGVRPYSSSGIADGRGGFAYLLHCRPGELDGAKLALGI